MNSLLIWVLISYSYSAGGHASQIAQYQSKEECEKTKSAMVDAVDRNKLLCVHSRIFYK